LADPLRGLSLGDRLAWYDRHDTTTTAATGTGPAAGPVAGAPGGPLAEVAALTERLRARDAALAAHEFLASQGNGWRAPGLYSWWVDQAGAADLSRGLGLPVAEGLIYAGLAGGTRWPSGRRS